MRVDQRRQRRGVGGRAAARRLDLVEDFVRQLGGQAAQEFVARVTALAILQAVEKVLVGAVFEPREVERFRHPDELRGRVFDAQLDLALRVGLLLRAFDLAAWEAVEQVHRQVRVADGGNRPLVVRGGLVRRRHVGDDLDAFGLEFGGDALAQGAQRVGGVGQEDCEGVCRRLRRARRGGRRGGGQAFFHGAERAIDGFDELAHLHLKRLLLRVGWVAEVVRRLGVVKREAARAPDLGGPLVERHVVEQHVEDAQPVADRQARRLSAGLGVKLAQLLLAIIRGEVAGRGQGDEERRAFEGVFNRLVEQLAAFERWVLPDGDRAHAPDAL